MSHNLYREPNKVKWVGMRPAHNGELVFAEEVTENSILTVYEVPAGKTLFITWSSLASAGNLSAAIDLRITDNLDVTQFRLHQGRTPSGGAGFDSDTAYFYPIEIDAGMKVRVRSGAAGVTAVGTIYGWVE